MLYVYIKVTINRKKHVRISLVLLEKKIVLCVVLKTRTKKQKGNFFLLVQYVIATKVHTKKNVALKGYFLPLTV